jgi:hypothetical protein
MKKIAIVMLLVMLGGINVLFAQSKGDKCISYLFGIEVTKHSEKVGSTTNEGKPYVKMEFHPGFHYFLADNFRVGAQMTLRRESQKYDSDGKYIKGTFLAGASTAYYMMLAEKYYFTPEIGLYYAHTKIKDKSGNTTTESKANGFMLQMLPIMVEFRPTEHYGFSASIIAIEYSVLKAKDADLKGKDFAFAFNISPRIGMRYYF